MSAVRVVLVDDHALMRQGISTILSAQPDIEAAYELFGHQRDGVLKVAITP